LRERIAASKLLVSALPDAWSLPVNLGKICEYLGVEVYMKHCDSLDAIFSLNGERKFLLVKEDSSLGRFRFSIAHELGHIVLKHRPLQHIFERREPLLERQADVFAAELLLPESFLREEWKRYTRAELAKRYKVSRQALEVQLTVLGLASRQAPESHHTRHAQNTKRADFTGPRLLHPVLE
jgi:Zn-dependent peptidase ImmA (M78 family)